MTDRSPNPPAGDSPETAPPPEPRSDAPADAAKEGGQGGGDSPRKGRETLLVRYGAMGFLARFAHHLDAWRCGQRVIVKSDRGQEMGTVVGHCCSGDVPESVPNEVKGEVLRIATHDDLVDDRHLRDEEDREADFCRQRIQARNLPMKLVAVEHLFGGDRILFYFVSEKRVDFRALVRDLAHEFQTRIEMRQIGVRDEARLLGDYERCGRPLCCRTWMTSLSPVSMKMAKVQKATLDPTKISGVCGRLMCCLRFEHATYKELAANLPRKKSYVRTAEGLGRVLNTDIVSQLVHVQLEAGSRVTVPVESLVERDLDPEAVRKEVEEAEEAARKRYRSSRRRNNRGDEGATSDSKGDAGGGEQGDAKKKRRRRPRGGRRRRNKGGKGGGGGGQSSSGGKQGTSGGNQGKA